MMQAPRLNSWSSSGRRVATGAIQFEGDLPGIFIRGEEAAVFAACLITLLRGNADRMDAEHVFDLGHLLISTHAIPGAKKQMKLRLRNAKEQFLDNLTEREEP